MRRGDIFTAAAGVPFGGKPRPVLVIQADEYLLVPVVMTAPLVDAKFAIDRIRPLILPDASNNLRKPSVIATNTLLAVRHDEFGRRIGVLSADDLNRADLALRLVLGLT